MFIGIGIGIGKTGIIGAAPTFDEVMADAIVAVSTARKIVADYEGSAFNLRETSGSTTEDIGFDEDGDVDTAAATAHLNGATGALPTIYDQSGNGNDFEQATAASQPTYQPTGVGDKPSASFDDTNDFMSAGDVEVHSNTDGITVFGACQCDATTTDADTIVAKYAGGASNAREWWLMNTSFNVQEQANAFNANSQANATGVTADQLLRGWWAPGEAAEIYRNGALVDTAAVTVTDITDTAQALVLGATTNGTGAIFTGDIAEVIIFPRKLTAAEAAVIEANINAYYSIV